MSKMVIEKNYFSDKAAAMEDIRDTGVLAHHLRFQ